MVRVPNHRPAAQIVIFARTEELEKLPAQKAIIDPSAMRQLLPNTASRLGWYIFMKSLDAGGSLTTTHAMNDAKASAPNPAHTTRRSRPYPYTSVRMSPKMYEIGKNSTPAPKGVGPITGRSTLAFFAAPMKFEHSSTATNAAITKS